MMALSNCAVALLKHIRAARLVHRIVCYIERPFGACDQRGLGGLYVAGGELQAVLCLISGESPPAYATLFKEFRIIRHLIHPVGLSWVR